MSTSSLFAPGWRKAVQFHGHACPGLAIGYRIAMSALTFLANETGDKEKVASPHILSPDEELVCIAETDACCVDAIQFFLGCTVGKGNLMLKNRGKMAMSFFYRSTEKAVRILWTGNNLADAGISREERISVILSAPEECILKLSIIPYNPPERAIISNSLVCANCGEKTAEFAIRLKQGQPYCLDCWTDPTRIL